MKRAAFLLIGFLVMAFAGLGQAQQRIAAVVNDEVISAMDVDTRVRLTMVTSGISSTPENRKRLEVQTIRGLVEERLQVQEAARVGVVATDREVADAIDRIERANKLQKGQIAALLGQSGLSLAPLEQQVRAGLTWQKLVQRRIRPQIHVTDEEIDELTERLKARAGAPEFLLSEIFLPLDNPDQEDDVRQTAISLIQQMQRGTTFPAIAQQFSRSASAGFGGDMGWVQEGQLDPELEEVVKDLKPGEVSAPIKTPGGFYIIGLRGRRAAATAQPDDTMIALTQLVFPAANPQQAQASEQLAQTARGAIGDCTGLAKLAREMRIQPPADPQRLRLGDVNPAIREKVRPLQPGQMSDPIRAGATIVLLVVCGREEPPSALPSRDDIEEMLLRQRLDLQARRYLRDLRRQANVEIRN